MAIDVGNKHPLPDWRKDERYVDAAAKLDAIRAVLPDLDAREANAMMAVSAATDALDECETLALANRAKPRDVALKQTALAAAQVALTEATAKREQAQRQARLLEGSIALLCDDARREVALTLSDAALAAVERLERALSEAVAANKDYTDLLVFIRAQFPGLPGDASYPSSGLGMMRSPWDDLRPILVQPGVKVETAYTRWVARMADWKKDRRALATARPSRATAKSA